MSSVKNDKSFYPTVSINVVNYLRDQGMTLKEIAGLMDVSESFISRVRNGHRSLTLQHLERLEKVLGKPLSIILMEATPVEATPRELATLYAAFRAFMAKLGEVVESDSSGSGDSHAVVA